MDDKSKLLLQMSCTKITALEKALEHNWVIQLVLAGLGVAFVFEIGDLPRALARYFSQDQYTAKPVALIILPVLLYYFTRFGHLLTSFIAVRRLHDQLFNSSFDGTFEDMDLVAIRETTSFFEPFYAGGNFRPILIAYFLFMPVVVSLTQASAMFLVVRAYGLNVVSIGIVGLSGIVLAILYLGFWRANRNHRATTVTAIACPVLVIGWLILFAKFA